MNEITKYISTLQIARFQAYHSFINAANRGDTFMGKETHYRLHIILDEIARVYRTA